MSGDTPTQPTPSDRGTLADGRYLLGRRLGAGGMGIVLQATDEQLHREVAVKLLADNLAADEVARERFLREARSAARVTDPHVVAVFDVGEDDGRPYLVMELVDGPSLADTLAAEGPLAPETVVDVAADALAGLARAHAAGVLHRDLKPANLLRAPDGTVKVADFGVAEAADAPGLTRTGLVIGTRSYLAPERAAGQPATVRTDLFAMGATLLELLTGRPPTAEDARNELHGVDGLPAGLAHLLDRMLTTDPQQRPASAEAAMALLAGEVEPPAADDTEVLRPEDLDGEGPPPAPPAAATSATTVATPAASGPDGAEAERTRALEADQDPPPATDHGGPQALPWRVVTAIAVALLLVAVAFQMIGGGDDAPVDAGGVERDEDPAETARNLGEWLRDQAEGR